MSVAAFITEARGALAGVMRLVIFDRSGAQRFPNDWDACARSFWTCVLALPAFFIPLGLEFAGAHAPADPLAATLARSVGYVVGCVAFPLASLPLLGWLGRGERWPILIYGYNWLSLVQNIAALLLLLLQSGGVLGGLTEPLFAVFYLLCISVEVFMFGVLLESGGVAMPIALVLLDLVLGAGIDTLSRAIA